MNRDRWIRRNLRTAWKHAAPVLLIQGGTLTIFLAITVLNGTVTVPGAIGLALLGTLLAPASIAFYVEIGRWEEQDQEENPLIEVEFHISPATQTVECRSCNEFWSFDPGEEPHVVNLQMRDHIFEAHTGKAVE